MAQGTVKFEYWYLGVFLAIIGCIVDAIGWMIEKRQHIKLAAQYHSLDNIHSNPTHKHSRRVHTWRNNLNKARHSIRYLSTCQWWLGFGTHSIGTLIFSISLGLGKQSLITPLQSFTLAFNTIFAWKFLNETLTRLQIIGTSITIIACSLCIAFGPRSSSNIHSATELQQYFKQADFVIFATVFSLLFLVNYIIYRWKLFAIVRNTTYIMFCQVGFSAYFGSWSALFTKCFVEIVANSSVSESSNWTHWLPYFCLLLMILTAVVLEYWRQEALKEHRANYVSSMYNTMIITGGISFGAIFFGEFQDMSGWMIFLFVLSVAISFVGVAMLTLGANPCGIIASCQCTHVMDLKQEREETENTEHCNLDEIRGTLSDDQSAEQERVGMVHQHSIAVEMNEKDSFEADTKEPEL